MCESVSRTHPSAPYPDTGNKHVAVLFPPPRPVKPGNIVLQPLYPPPVPVVVETINPTAASPFSCGDHRSRDLGAVLVVDSKESTTHGVNLVVLPSRLTLHLSFRVFFYHPLFGRLLALCVVPLPPKNNHTCVPPGFLPTPLLT